MMYVYVLHFEWDGDSLRILVLFDDDSVDFVEFAELMAIAPNLRAGCLLLLMEEQLTDGMTILNCSTTINITACKLASCVLIFNSSCLSVIF